MEEELIERARQGDIAAFESLISKYQADAYNFACHFTGNRDDAYDITQEALIKVFKALPKFKGGCAFSTWLYRIVYNTYLDNKKKAYNRHKVSEVPLDDTRLVEEQPGEPGISADSVKSALALLPEKFRSIITLYHVETMSYSEISRVTGLSQGTVMSRLNRARKKLKKIFLEKGIFNRA
ncbi:MAG: hypothetical protein A2297_01425 [Elusimicrobia bacterium RIFOXYB2_FULL_48_7]|nr:MAG: hypothetical protein A2297_01425 [Elusimicrobia bacterium RIFOXYB2_FULL_48_7]